MHAIPHLSNVLLSSCEIDCSANCSNAFTATIMRWDFSVDSRDTESIQSATSLSGLFTSREPGYQDTGMTVTQFRASAEVAKLHHVWVCVFYIGTNNKTIISDQTFQLAIRRVRLLFHYLSQLLVSWSVGLEEHSNEGHWKSCCGGRELVRNKGWDLRNWFFMASLSCMTKRPASTSAV